MSSHDFAAAIVRDLQSIDPEFRARKLETRDTAVLNLELYLASCHDPLTRERRYGYGNSLARRPALAIALSEVYERIVADRGLSRPSKDYLPRSGLEPELCGDIDEIYAVEAFLHDNTVEAALEVDVRAAFESAYYRIGYNLQTGKRVAVAAPALSGIDGILPRTNSGTAAHPTPIMAVRSAVFELAERDALIRTWHSGGLFRRIEGILEPDVEDLAESLKLLGFQLSFFSTDLTLAAPTIVATICSVAGVIPACVCGTGTGADFEVAIKKAASEVLTHWVLIRSNIDVHLAHSPQLTPADQADIYIHPEQAKRLSSRFSISKTVSATCMKDAFSQAWKNAVATLDPVILSLPSVRMESENAMDGRVVMAWSARGAPLYFGTPPKILPRGLPAMLESADGPFFHPF